MHISPEGEIGIFLGLLALLGSGAIMRFPTHLWIGSTMIASSIVGFILLAFQHFEIWQMRTVPGFGMIISAAIFLGCAVWYFWPFTMDNKIAPLQQNLSQNAENARRAALLGKLRQEYILSHDGISPALAAGLENPPAEWTNERLQQLGEQWPATAPIVQNMTLSNEQKKQLIKSFIVLKPTTKSIVLNRSSSTKNNLWSELADVFNRAGFGSVGGSVQTGFQESANPDETGVMICTNDPNSPSKIDAIIKDALEKIGIKSKYIPLSEATYKGDITIFVGPDPL